jgi:ABC-type multidrug transport system ATPase subunit
MSTTIELKSVSKIYDLQLGHPVTALNNITLSIPAGQVFGILGGSGAGKTTLIKLLGGLIEPTYGDIELNGLSIAGQVGVSLEGTSAIDDTLTQEDPAKSVSKEHLEQLLLRSDMWRDRDKPVNKLPYSRQRQLSILRALVHNPTLLLLDEPFSGLDLRMIKSMKLSLPKLAHELGKTIVIATRDPDIAQELCDHVAILYEGQLVTSQSTSELLQSTRPESYHIRVKGYLNSQWAAWFDGLNITHTENGESIISGPIFDQSALHGVLYRIHNLALPVVSVDHARPKLTAIYQNLIKKFSI